MKLVTKSMPRVLDWVLAHGRPWIPGIGRRVHGRVRIGHNWEGHVYRCRKPWDAEDRTPFGWTRTVSGLLAPTLEPWHCWNIVTNVGLNDALDVHLSGATQDTTWFLGLAEGSPSFAAGDTLASHGGWTESTAYDEANRQAWTDGGVSSQSVDNSGSPATFTCSTNSTTWGGAFLAGVNSGTSGILYAGSAFSEGDKAVDDGDTLDATATFTAADDGA